METGGKIGKGERGPGRPPGSPNKMGAAVKDMILEALGKAGGSKYLLKQAKDNPNAFLALVGKVLPLDVNNKHSGGVRVIHVPVPKTKLDE